jgi:hypothetical protein
MMKRKLGWMLLGVTSLACSGRYEVGGMDATAGNQGAAGGTASGGASTGPTAGSGTMQPGDGGATDDTPSGIERDCLTASAPKPITGPFAAPAVVWHRVAMLTGGPDATPPELPEETTYEWAASLVPLAIANAHVELGTAPGVEIFLRQWLRLAPEAAFDVDWSVLVSVPKPALEILLWTTPKPNRTGIFTEPGWLAQYSLISTRGASIERSLFNIVAPAPPAGVSNPEPDPTLSDRASLERSLASPVCASCHQLIDPSGFALGHFAADGSYRELDHGPIDAKGQRYANGGNGMVAFDGIADFGQKYANTCEATLGFSDAFLRAALIINEAPETAQENLFEANHARVQQAFVNGGRSYDALVTAYIQSPAGLRP